MKKLFALALVAGMVTFVACGPSKADQEKKEKERQDSINSAEKAKREADSLARVEADQRRMDSLRQDSIQKAEKNKPKPKQGYHPQGQAPKTTTSGTTAQPKGTRPGGTTKKTN
ncbi:MAG TPA: hypothetical protein PKK00_06530 [Bacteroidales bacterium]|nr:hypothetical protein [Bacteroidales bacterium]HPS16946.1 hypothetical protein [Bacteroidales bacterium]